LLTSRISTNTIKTTPGTQPNNPECIVPDKHFYKQVEGKIYCLPVSIDLEKIMNYTWLELGLFFQSFSSYRPKYF